MYDGEIGLKLKKRNECILLFLLLSVIIVFCFLLHGAWPFGSLTIEGDDGYQQHIPEMYYLWDLLHGQKGLFFDWNTALGGNPVGSMLHFGIFSPLNLVYLFIPRSAVLYSTSALAMLRLLLLALSFRYMLRRLLPEETASLFVILLSVLYSCNSWTFHYLYFFQWIDIAILLPLLIVKLCGVLDDGRSRISFTLLLTLSFLICIQQDYMLVIFLILFSGIRVFLTKSEKKERHAAILRLGYLSLTAFFLSAVILLPAVAQVSSSSRMSASFLFTLKEMLRSNADPDHTYDAEKLILSYTAFNVSLLSFFLLVIRRIKKIRVDRETAGLALMWLFLFIPVFAESCHYLWQGGSYLCFPLRGGYMLPCITILLAGRLLSPLSGKKALRSRTLSAAVLLLFCIALIFLGKMRMYRAELGLHRNKQDLYRSENLLYSEYAGTPAGERFLDKASVLNVNYPLVSDTASGENWIHIIPASLPEGWEKLGLYHAGSAIYGQGGTILSDALLGTRYTIWKEAPDPRLYENIRAYDGFYIAENRLTLPFGLLLDQTDPADAAPLDTQAFLLREIYGLENMEIRSLKAGEETILNAGEDCLLYLENTRYEDNRVSVNGEDFAVQPLRLNYLGIHNGELRIRAEKDARIGSIPLDPLLSAETAEAVSGLVMEGRRLECRVENDRAGRILFLPVTEQKGWECHINGTACEHITLLGGFIGIPLPESRSCSVELIYHPPLLLPGILLSICGLILLICEMRLQLTEKLAKLRISPLCTWIFCAILFGIVFVGYILNLLFLFLPKSLWWWLLKPKG